MAKKVLISVIVPVYNLENEALKCLWSLALQKFKDFEVVVIDDGSTDNSLSILKKFAKKDKRFLVFHKKNGGLSSARNFGLKKARGEFISFVDGDDNVDPGFLEELYNSTIKNGAEVSISGYTNFFKEKMTDFVPKSEVISGEEATIRLLTRQENMEILTWNKLYKKELFSRIKFPDGKICEDNLTTYKLLAKANKVAYITGSFYNYCRRENSISFKMDDLERLKIREEAAREAEQLFKNNLKLKQAAEASKLLAYFKFIDHSLSGRISEKYFKTYREKILKTREAFLKNPMVDSRRKKYVKMISIKNGGFYKLYRKIKHD